MSFPYREMFVEAFMFVERNLFHYSEKTIFFKRSEKIYQTAVIAFVIFILVQRDFLIYYFK